MCGIAGIVSRSRGDLATARAMAAALRHRGPDDEGYVAIDATSGRAVPLAGSETPDSCRTGALPFLPGDAAAPETADVVLAARRLAILDLSPSGHQPLGSPDGRDWIVHNGEIYNYVELRAELSTRGHRFAGTSDTEVALAAYREWGTRCFERFNGMWAQAIWDGARRRLVLARDRFGVKPLYLASSADGIAFASEIKALLAANLVDPRPNQLVLRRFLQTGRIDSTPGQTCFAAVRQVQAGTFVEYEPGGRPRPTRYYTPHAGETTAGADEQLRELLDDAVRLRLRSDVPVGSCLSGGLDSSSVVALAQRRLANAGTRLQSFTFAAGDGRHDERSYAAAVAEAVGAQARYTTEPDGLPDVVAAVSREQDEPFGSGSVVAQREVMALARANGVKVLLDGQGGDEVLAGYKYYVAARLADELGSGHPARWARDLAAARRNALLPTAWLVRATAGELRRRRGRERLREQQLEDVRDHLPALLHYEDRNSMAFSIETRLPFLDYRFVELGLSLSGRAKIDGGWTKLALRRAFDADLPEQVVWRRDKIQFSVPQVEWLSGPLHELASDLFASAAFTGREGVDAAAVRERLAGGLEASDADRIWRHLSLELWYRAYVDSPSARTPPLVAAG